MIWDFSVSRKWAFRHTCNPEIEVTLSLRSATNHPNFDFLNFYARLNQKRHGIYPGKLSHAECFRFGHVGRLVNADVRALLAPIAETLTEMDINLSA
jgi:aspartate aminotransferase-like enzyme